MNRVRAIDLLSAAFKLDRAAREAEAIPLYRRAIRAGLKGDSLRDALVCLGSSLITVGRPQAAVRILNRARREFPADIVPTMFLALALYHSGKPALALRMISEKLIARSSPKSLDGYDRVLLPKYRALRSPIAAADFRGKARKPGRGGLAANR